MKSNNTALLTISNMQVGVGESPYLGFGKLNNLELFEKPGVAKIQFATKLSFSTTSLPTAMVYDTLGNQYVGCLSGEFYMNGVLINTGGGICDLAIISDGTTDPNGYPIEYVLITRTNDSFNFYGPTYSGLATFNGGQSGLASNHWKKIIVGIDTSTNNTPIVYIGNGNKIGAITNFTAAAAGSPPTYTWNSAALYLQLGHYAYTMEQQGKYLVIGTHGSPYGYSGAGQFKRAGLFYWDRTSTSYNIPIFFKENGIPQLLQIQNKLLIGAGNRGRISITDGTNFEQIKRIPFCFNRQWGTLGNLFPNAMTLHNGEVVVGISTQNGGGDTQGNYGVYTIPLAPVPTEKGSVQYPSNLRNTISTGYTGNDTSRPLLIGMLHSTAADQLYIGWQDGSTYGVDSIDIKVVPGYGAVIESPYVQLGTELEKMTAKRAEVNLGAPLVSGQSIRISWREDSDSSTWTEMFTWTSTDFGSNISHSGMANIASKVNVQFKIELNQDNTVAFGNNIEFRNFQLFQGIN